MRRRRRKLVAWLPNLAWDSPQDEKLNFIWSSFMVDQRGVLQTYLTPLVRDEDERTTQSLAEYTQGGYILQRIVGKLRFAMQQRANPEGPEVYPAVARVKAAFEVLRVDTNGTPLASAAPETYNPDNELNERDPWIWQRSWWVCNAAASIVVNGAASNYSEGTKAFYQAAHAGNFPYGSALEATNIDVKIKRRIGPEERLFLVTSTWQPDDLGETGLPLDVHMDLDYRILGTPIRATNRRNASR